MSQASLATGLKAKCLIAAIIAAVLLLCVSPVAYADDAVVSEGEAATLQPVEAPQAKAVDSNAADSNSDGQAEPGEPSGSADSEKVVLEEVACPSPEPQPVDAQLPDQQPSDQQPSDQQPSDAQLADSQAESQQASEPQPPAPESDDVSQDALDPEVRAALADEEVAVADVKSVDASAANADASKKVVVTTLEPDTTQIADETLDPTEATETTEATEVKTALAYATYDPIKRSLVFDRGARVMGLRSIYYPLVFTGFEDTSYEVAAEVPWAYLSSYVVSVVFKDTIAPSSTAFWFASCSKLESFDAGGRLDMSRATSARGMFSNCSSLKSVVLTGWDTSNLLDVSGMFDGCESMQEAEGLDKVMVSLASKGPQVSGFESLGSFVVSQLGMSKDDFTVGEGGETQDVEPGENGVVDSTQGEVDPSTDNSAGEPVLNPVNAEDQQPVTPVTDSGSAIATIVNDGATGEGVAPIGNGVASNGNGMASNGQKDLLPATNEESDSKPVANAARPFGQRNNGGNAAVLGELIEDDAVPMSAFGLNAGPAGGVLDKQPDEGSEIAALASAHSLLQSIADGSQSSQVRMGVASVLFDLLQPDNPYAVIIAGISLVAAAFFMLTFCLNLH